MINLDLTTATEIAPAVFTAECPTTHQLFVADHVRRQSIGVRPVVWMLCACCDAQRHTGDACDPCEPQWHLFWEGR